MSFFKKSIAGKNTLLIIKKRGKERHKSNSEVSKRTRVITRESQGTTASNNEGHTEET